jgi:hypothetical protein
MRLRPIRPKPPGWRAAELVLVPLVAGLLAVGVLAARCGGDEPSSRPAPQEYRNFSPRPVTGPESIQLSPCQRSAADCFAAGGLDTLMDNLDGLAIDPRTGRFCFAFQDGCDRR